MKFGDKLISLRKKHGLSQEDLASKLNVSRQSVSKWESNNTYPETDKIIQICNIFDCKMDDLINDKVTDLEQCERKNKNTISVAFDSLLEFLTKSVNMFSSMKFGSAVRTVLELFLLVICLVMGGAIVVSICTNVVMNFFTFLEYGKVYNIIGGLVSSIFEIIFILLGAIIFLHIYKIRYLDYYDRLMLEAEDNDNDEMIENVEKGKDKDKNRNKDTLTNAIKDNKEDKKNKIDLEKKEPRIIIRDKEHEPFAFLSIISKMIIGFCRFLTVFLVGGFAFLLVGLVFAFVVLLSLGFSSLLFVGADLGIISAIVINLIILVVLIYFVIAKKANLKLLSYIFLGSLVICGVGCGLCFVGIKDFKFIDADSSEYQSDMHELSRNISYEDNMIISQDFFNEDCFNIVIDESMGNDINVKALANAPFKNMNLAYSEYSYYGADAYHFWLELDGDFTSVFKAIKKDLDNHIIRNYDNRISKLTIVCSSDVANKLILNMRKVYLFELKPTENGYLVSEISDAIDIDQYDCEARYNALTGEVSYDDSYCTCEKRVIKTPLGDRINFDCKNIYDENMD